MKIKWNLIAASGSAHPRQVLVEERSRMMHVSVMLLILAAVVLIVVAPAARAENGDGCAEGYAWGSAPYQVQVLMVNRSWCKMLDAIRSARKIIGAPSPTHP